MSPSPHLDEVFLDLDWYARDLVDETFRDCTFRDVDLTESTSHGAVFESCTSPTAA